MVEHATKSSTRSTQLCMQLHLALLRDYCAYWRLTFAVSLCVSTCVSVIICQSRCPALLPWKRSSRFLVWRAVVKRCVMFSTTLDAIQFTVLGYELRWQRITYHLLGHLSIGCLWFPSQMLCWTLCGKLLRHIVLDQLQLVLISALAGTHDGHPHHYSSLSAGIDVGPSFVSPPPIIICFVS